MINQQTHTHTHTYTHTHIHTYTHSLSPPSSVCKTCAFFWAQIASRPAAHTVALKEVAEESACALCNNGEAIACTKAADAVIERIKSGKWGEEKTVLSRVTQTHEHT